PEYEEDCAVTGALFLHIQLAEPYPESHKRYVQTLDCIFNSVSPQRPDNRRRLKQQTPLFYSGVCQRSEMGANAPIFFSYRLFCILTSAH
uniref:hypothetical protein n=1 Tax=Cellvibrio fontiphilus TaxID=1815559 RepID=UPI002B4C01DD